MGGFPQTVISGPLLVLVTCNHLVLMNTRQKENLPSTLLRIRDVAEDQVEVAENIPAKNAHIRGGWVGECSELTSNPDWIAIESCPFLCLR
jgi:hypothetical protein